MGERSSSAVGRSTEEEEKRIQKMTKSRFYLFP